MLLSMILDIIVSFLIVTFGIPGLTPAPIKDTLLIFGLALVFDLLINNFVKKELKNNKNTVVINYSRRFLFSSSDFLNIT